jgi:hypothetical protein
VISEQSSFTTNLKTIASIVGLVVVLGSAYWANRNAIEHLEATVTKLEEKVAALDRDVQRLEVDLARISR